MSTILVEDEGRVRIVTIDRPETRNAVDASTADELVRVFEEFDVDDNVDVAILTGSDATFCSGADLKAIAGGEVNRMAEAGHGPLGPTRMMVSKPVIAAIEGYAVAGGFELAIWCDLRIASEDAVVGIYNRRFGVPLVDMGTIRLPRLIGHSRAMDLILTGRAVGAEEALAMGIMNRVVPTGSALDAALDLARDLCALPQVAMRNDRLSALEQWSLTEEEAIRNEVRHGLATVLSGETLSGATSFKDGHGRHGKTPYIDARQYD